MLPWLRSARSLALIVPKVAMLLKLSSSTRSAVMFNPLGKVLALTKTCLLPALIVGLLMVNVSPARKPFWSTKLLFANSAPMTSILLAAMN